MYLNVSQLLREPIGSVRRFDVSEDISGRVASETLTLKGFVTLLRTDRGVWVSGELESNPRCECSRCLRSFEETFVIKMEEEFFPMVDPQDVTVTDVTQVVEGKFWIDHDHILDLDGLIMESLEVGIPMKPICDVGCAGMCSMCGVDLNQSRCDCDNEFRDTRWGPLLEASYSSKVNVN